MRSAHALLALTALGCNARWEPADTARSTSDAPHVELIEPLDGATGLVSEPVIVRAIVTDDHDDPTALLVEIRSDVAGVVARPYVGSDGAVNADILLETPGVHTLSVVAVDLEGYEGEAHATIELTTATTPTAPSVEITPEAPIAGDTLVAEIVAGSVDPEGDPLWYVWLWSVDGVETAYAEATLDGSVVEAGQVWSVSVHATDGASVSDAASATVTVSGALAR